MTGPTPAARAGVRVGAGSLGPHPQAGSDFGPEAQATHDDQVIDWTGHECGGGDGAPGHRAQDGNDALAEAASVRGRWMRVGQSAVALRAPWSGMTPPAR